MKFLISAAALIFSVSAFAGSSSTVGTGAPQWEYKCSDKSGNLNVVVMRVYPNYDADLIAVTTTVPHSALIDDKVQREPGDRPGAPLKFIGRRFALTVENVAPQFVDGHTVLPGSVSDLSNDPTTSVVLSCQVLPVGP